tara:strand:+ start:240 stop:428 length:189 start_codon:yes stop_codon:yes gene_type:complete
MITQSRFLKNSEYVKDMDSEPMFRGTIDIGGKIYDGEFYRQIEYGKEVMVLCLKTEESDQPF